MSRWPGILAVGLAACVLPAGVAYAQGPVLLAVRYDDFMGPPQSGPDERLALERELLPALAHLGLTPTVAVLPHANHYASQPVTPLTEPGGQERVVLLRELLARGEIQVALHGDTGDLEGGGSSGSEFAGLPREEQQRRLTSGQRALDAVLGQPVRTLVPSHNTYDRVTLDVLVDQGFGLISAALGQSPATREELRYVPSTCNWSHLEEAVDSARRYAGPTLVMLMLHPFEVAYAGQNPDQPTVVEVEATLRRLRDLPGVQGTSLGEIAARYPELAGAAHMRASSRLARYYSNPLLRRVLAVATGDRSRWAYWPEGVYRRAAWVLGLPFAAGALVGLLVGLPAARLLRPGRRGRRLLLAVVAALAVAAAVWLTWRGGRNLTEYQALCSALALAALTLAARGRPARARR